MRVTKIQRKFRRVSLHSLLGQKRVSEIYDSFLLRRAAQQGLDAVTDEEVFHSHVFFGCHGRLTDQNGDHFAAHVLQRRRLGEKLRRGTRQRLSIIRHLFSRIDPSVQ